MTIGGKQGASQKGFVVALIREENGKALCSYPMFGSTQLSEHGGFLGGQVFLEVGERVAISITFEDGEEFHVAARVDGLQFGESPGVVVTFSHSSPEQRTALGRKISSLQASQETRLETGTDGGND